MATAYVALGANEGDRLANLERAVRRLREITTVDVLSPIYETEPYREAIDVAFKFAAEMRDKHGLRLKEFSPGGGFPIQYTADKPILPLAEYAEIITGAVKDCCAKWEFEPPALFVEPGRAIVGRAGVALYTAGARKEIPQVRTYVSVDGGMGDNIRPAIYGSRYEALVANHVRDTKWEKITIAGKYCESGDVLIKDIDLPPVAAGDLIAIPASGAYCIPMSSNYNTSPRPAVVLVKDGKATLWARRETIDDLLRREAL